MERKWISLKEACHAYGVEDTRTIRARALKGYILFQVINPKSKRPRWLIESPDARYERLYGDLLTN